MKLSTLSTEESLSVLCELTPYVSNIAADEKLLEEIRNKIHLPAGASRTEVLMAGAQKLSAVTPILLKDHKRDIFGILAALNRKTPEEIARQNILKTGAQLMEIIQDEDLMLFFKSYGMRDNTE